MKRSLTILLAILSVLIFSGVKGDQAVVCVDDITTEHFSIEDCTHSFSQGNNFVDLKGRQGSSSTVSVTKVVTKNSSSRRHTLDNLSGVKLAVASLYSERGYSYSCNFPFEHQPQRELFFILRNIRI